MQALSMLLVIACSLAAPRQADLPVAAAAEAAEAVPEVELPPGTINIALLGVDKRPSRSFNNTDVIILASINPDVPAVTLLSIPRDWPVYIPGYGVYKVNQAYGFGGPNLFKRTILNNFGLRLDYYAMVNFEGLVRAVDTLGGVQVIATCRLYHVFPRDPYYMGGSIVTTRWVDTFTGEVWKPGARVPTTVLDIPKPGVYDLNGLEALAFVRARKGVPGGDRDRGRREQRVVRALFARAKQLDVIPKLPELLDQFNTYVKTDIPLDEMVQLMSIANRFDDAVIRSRFLDQEGAGGAALALEDETQRTATHRSWAAMIQQMLTVALNQRPNDGIPVEVWNGTGDAGFATAAVDRLQEVGFRVVETKAADHLYSRSEIVDFTTTSKGSAIPLLLREFNLSRSQVSAQPAPDGPRYRIVVGPDFQTCYYDDETLYRRDELEQGEQPVEPVLPYATPTAVPTPEPTATPPAVATSAPVTASAVITAAPTGLLATIPDGYITNVRSGPGLEYPVIGALTEKQVALVTGRTADSRWLRIRFGNQTAWIAARLVHLSGDLNAVWVVAP